MTIEAFPLAWPFSQPRTSERKDARFKVTTHNAVKDLLAELKLLGAKDVVLSTNVPAKSNGLLYSSFAAPSDPGVAIYFQRNGKPFVLACDQYRRVEWNLRAIGLTVEALRSIQRYGASSMLEQAFTGFAALPAHGAAKPWWAVLGVSQQADFNEARMAFQELVRIYHPDHGGSHEKMIELNAAWKEAQERYRNAQS